MLEKRPVVVARREILRHLLVSASLALVFAGVLVACASVVDASPLFASRFLCFDAGAEPSSFAVGDLNGDGTLDMAVANAGAHSFSVLLGNGDGTFGAKKDYEMALYPSAIGIADLNGDARPDLVVTNTAYNKVSVFMGTGNGAFAFLADFATGGSPSSIAVADVNGDGRLDLAISNNGSSTVSILLGVGTGALQPKADFATGSHPRCVAIGDLNGDGNLDLALANAGEAYGQGGSVSVLLGDGSGAFGPKIDSVTGSLSSLAIADLNGDGYLDLAVTLYDLSAENVTVLLGDGSGSFGAGTAYDAGSALTSVAIGDLNADGRPDLALTNFNDNFVSVLYNGGDEGFGPRKHFPTGSGPGRVAIADLNGDGRPDIATANHGDYHTGFGALSVLLANDYGSFGVDKLLEVGDRPCAVTIGDVNGDGKLDVAVASANWSTVAVLLGAGDGSFGPQTAYLAGNTPWAMAMADLNDDGRSDLVVTNDGSSSVSVLLGNSDGTMSARTEFPTSDNSRAVAIGDLNGDGIADLAVAGGPNGAGTVSVLLGTGGGAFGLKTEFPCGGGPLGVAIGDVNGDGRPDLATANNGFGSGNTASVLLGSGDGSFGPNVEFQTGTHPQSIAIADLNADGKQDLAVGNFDAGWAVSTVSVLFGHGDGTFAARTNFAVGGSPVGLMVGDLNLDGNPDVVVANSAGTANSVSVLLGNGSSALGPRVDFGTGNVPVSVAMGDLNGDEMPDLCVVNRPDNLVSVLINTAPNPGTPTLIELFRAVASADGVRIEWQLSDPGAFRSLELQRSSSETGEWILVGQAPVVQGRVASVLDADAASGGRWWYRLSGVRSDGHLFTFGPISADAQEDVTAFALARLSPNPSDGQSQVTFSIPTRTRVRLTVTDVQGREVAVLSDGVRAAGRYAAMLDASDLRAGIYFVRMQAANVNLARRLVIVR
jgi:hypothetical protein